MASYSLFDHLTQPTLTNDANAAGQYNVGVVWKPATDGTVTSIWIYASNYLMFNAGGAASLYVAGTLTDPANPPLAQKNFTFASTAGWQEVVLDTPVNVTGGTNYIAAVYVASGGWCNTANFFTADYVKGPLTAVDGHTGTTNYGNGRFYAGGPATYPSSNATDYSNYWVDVTFVDNGNSNPVATVITKDIASPNVGSTVTFTATPSNGTTYTYNWSVQMGSGTLGSPTAAQTTYVPSATGRHTLNCVVNGVASYHTFTVGTATTSGSGTFTATVTDPLNATATSSALKSLQRGGQLHMQQRSLYGNRLSFGDAVTNQAPLYEVLGDGPGTFVVRTYMQRDCVLTKIRFLKAPAATGQHIVVVWQMGNYTPLAEQAVDLVADGGSWVEVTLDSPVALTASDTVPYFIGYYSPEGKVMRAQWVYGSQPIVEYPFYIGTNGGGFGQVEGSGYSAGRQLRYPSSWIGHSYFIDPVVEWPSDDAVYEGGLEYYQRFSAMSAANRFPIGAWQPLAASIPGFEALGINTAVTLGGDFDAARDAIVASGLDVFQFLEINDTATLAQLTADTAYNAHVKGYIIRDEPDMIPPWNPPQQLRDWYAEIRRRDASKLVIFNLGKWTVLNKGFAYLPSGASLKDANGYWREFAHITDIVSCDFYMEDPTNLEGIYGLWCNPRMVGRLRDLSDGTRPVWHYIATTAAPGSEPSPQLVYNSVWASLIGGARGIVFFDHQFNSNGTWITDFAMNTNTAMATMVKSLITLIQSLAGPLLAPEANISVQAASSATTANPVGGYYGVPIHYTSRQDSGSTYLFTQAIRPGTTTATFTVPAAANKTITVINESRTLTANGSGVFTDSFSADYQVHLYRWT